MNKKKGCLLPVFIIIGLFTFGLIFGISKIVSNQEEYSNVNKEQSKVSMLIDANKFSRISPDELKKILGEPSNIEKWNNKTSKGNIPMITYTYENGKYEFLIADNHVVRFNYYGKQSFNNKNDLFTLFGITPSSNMKKITDTGSAIRYQLVSDKIADFWVIDIENKTFNSVKITYNLNYFD